MTNQFDTGYAILDDNGIIFKGRLDMMVYAWNTNYLADFAFKNIYGHSKRDPKWIIKKYNGDLRLIQIVDKTNDGPGEHKTWLKIDSTQCKE